MNKLAYSYLRFSTPEQGVSKTWDRWLARLGLIGLAGA